MASGQRIVVKLGTNVLTGEAFEPDQAYLETVADEVVALREQGHEVLLEMGVVPVVNENDVVSIEEIEGTSSSFGDNDKLSAYVATKARAELLILLSDVDGLYTRPPGQPGAELVQVVEETTPEVEQMAGVGTSIVGQGGMAAKLEAARIANQAGIHMVIANGRTPQVRSRKPGPTPGWGAARKHLGVPEEVAIEFPLEVAQRVDAEDAWTRVEWAVGTKGAMEGRFYRERVRVVKDAGNRWVSDEVGWLLFEKDDEEGVTVCG